jgi:hypothetical protein
MYLPSDVKINGKIFSVPGDGHCLFSSISLLLHNSIEHWKYYRCLSAFMISENFDLLKAVFDNGLIDIDECLKSRFLNTLVEEEESISKEKWGSSIHLMALSYHLKRNIYVIGVHFENNLIANCPLQNCLQNHPHIHSKYQPSQINNSPLILIYSNILSPQQLLSLPTQFHTANHFTPLKPTQFLINLLENHNFQHLYQ